MYEVIIPHYVHHFDVLKFSLICVKGAHSRATDEIYEDSEEYTCPLLVFLPSEGYKRVDLDFI